MSTGRELLIEGIEKLNIEYSEKQIDQFMEYYEMLIETNKVMNLTTITDIDEVMVKHFIDSILIASTTSMDQYSNIIDVGTGAGFPGIPIKILFPHLKVTLLDSLNKRLKFLEEVINKLELKNVELIHGRAEDIARDKNYRENYDLCVSRAVANLSVLSEYCIPFIKIDGKFVSYKSSISDDEINDSKNAIGILGGEIINKMNVELPCSDMQRTFVMINKKKSTPKVYPRKAGTPTKKPIK